MIDERVTTEDKRVTHLHLALEVGRRGSHFVRTENGVELALFLTEQFVPAVRFGHLDQLGDTKGQGAHEVIARCPVPVPDLHGQSF